MFTEERHEHILNLLKNNGKVLVKDLSKEFNVSESMIRKDEFITTHLWWCH